MKKNYFLLGLLAMSMTMVSCSKSEDSDDSGSETNIVTPTGMPEGTDDPRVKINETDANYADYAANWCNYANVVSNLLKSDAAELYKAWNDDFNGEGPFKETFKNHLGDYNSYNACIEQIIDGCIDIANEVGETKIGDPRDKWENGKYTEAVYAVESWYSYHSIEDYANNIRSIQNAINCTYGGKAGQHSIAKYLVDVEGQPALATKVNSAIQAAITAIESMAAPFRSHIGNNSVVTAMDACQNLKIALREVKARVEYFDNEEELKALVADYVDVVVLPTYKDLKEANEALNVAVSALANNPSNATFEAAANAWMAARGPWESGEAFLFGPVDELGLDPNMDSWPLDQDAIKNVLASGDYSELNWDDEDSDEKIEAAQNIRGFHTLEFLLFKNGQPRTIQ